MNKNELISVVAEETKFTKKDVGVILDSVFENISKALTIGENVKIAGFGGFEVKVREERQGVNPKTQEKILIPASKTVKFKLSQSLKDKLNQ